MHVQDRNPLDQKRIRSTGGFYKSTVLFSTLSSSLALLNKEGGRDARNREDILVVGNHNTTLL
jgi:hypothetical protein